MVSPILGVSNLMRECRVNFEGFPEVTVNCLGLGIE